MYLLFLYLNIWLWSEIQKEQDNFDCCICCITVVCERMPGIQSLTCNNTFDVL